MRRIILIDECQIQETTKRIHKDTFTALDFMKTG